MTSETIKVELKPTPDLSLCLARRKETERLILREHEKLKLRLDRLRISNKKAKQALAVTKVDVSNLNLKSSSLSNDIEMMKIKIVEYKNKTMEVGLTIDTLLTKREQATMVLKKEEKTVDAWYQKMMTEKNASDEFMNKTLNSEELNKIKLRINGLDCKKLSLIKELVKAKETFDDQLSGLSTEIMIIKKKNEALQKRLARKREDRTAGYRRPTSSIC